MARVRHRMRWRSLGAATTFLLAAAAGATGNRLTGHLTPALVAFALIVAVGALITYILDRQASLRDSADAAAKDNAARQFEPIDLRGAQGVQIGDDNWQRNYFDAGPKSGSHE